MSANETTLGPFWRQRYWVARHMINAALWIMPRSHYRTGLIDILFAFRWHVEDTVRNHMLSGSAPEVINNASE